LSFFHFFHILGKSANMERRTFDLKESLETMGEKRYGTYGRKES
jgi:hypothetical protein